MPLMDKFKQMETFVDVVAKGSLARGELVSVLGRYALPHYDIMAVYPRQRQLPAKVRFFYRHAESSVCPARLLDLPLTVLIENLATTAV